MKKSTYNPKIHHRRSIRLKSHDYSGGGLYFVTLCAHKEFIAATRATRMSPVLREIFQEEMQRTASTLPWMHWEEHVIMPDHFHALIKIEGGHGKLGDVVGGFKAGVTRHIRRRGDILVAPILVAPIPGAPIPGAPIPGTPIPGTPIPGTPPPQPTDMPPRIWHRNYYEMIVRTPEAEKNIRNYIKMNPWRIVMDFGNGLRGMGNPSLWNHDKLGVLCSRNAPPIKEIPEASVYMSGFHSQPERELLARLLQTKANIIYCPAWGLESTLNADVIDALENNRMLILEMKNQDGNLAAAEQRNRHVLQNADQLWLPHVNPGGMLSKLVRELRMKNED